MAISILQNEDYLEEAMFEGVTLSPKKYFSNLFVLLLH